MEGLHPITRVLGFENPFEANVNNLVPIKEYPFLAKKLHIVLTAHRELLLCVNVSLTISAKIKEPMLCSVPKSFGKARKNHGCEIKGRS